MRATHVVGFDLQPGNRIGAGAVGQDQVVVPLIAVGLLRDLVDFDHAPPHRAAVVLLGGLIQKVAVTVRRAVILQGVIGQVLPTLGEHHAVDLAVRPRADQIDRLVDLRQPGTHRGDRPLKRRVAIDGRLLVGEVIRPVAPFLDVDVTQVRSRTLDDFDAAQVQSAGVGREAVAFVQHRRLGAVLNNDQRVRRVGPAVGQQAADVDRTVDDDAPRDVQELPAAPERRVRGGVPVVGRFDDAVQVFADEVAVGGGQCIQAAEDDAFSGQGFVDVRGHDAAVDRFQTPAGVERLLVAAGIPRQQLVIFAGEVLRRHVGQRRRELMQLERADVGADPFLVLAGRPVHRFGGVEHLPAVVDEPAGFVTGFQEGVETGAVEGQRFGQGGGGHEAGQSVRSPFRQKREVCGNRRRQGW